MDLCTIKPYVGFGDLSFGMDRIDVRELLKGNEFKPFSRSNKAYPDIDFYVTLGFQLNYDQGDKLEFIEVFEPANPSYDGITFLGKQLEESVLEIQYLGHKVIYDDLGTGCAFPTLGFGLYIEDDEDGVEAVSIYRRGYYDGTDWEIYSKT